MNSDKPKSLGELLLAFSEKIRSYLEMQEEQLELVINDPTGEANVVDNEVKAISDDMSRHFEKWTDLFAFSEERRLELLRRMRP